MNKSGPIIILEDDAGYQELFKIAFKEINLKNDILYFEDGEQALEFLIASDIKPFFKCSDINMPKLNGLELKAKIHSNEQLRLRCIPFLFFSTTADQHHVIDAYSKSVQGFFIKPDSYTHLLRTMKIIIDYWQECESPNYIR